MSGLEVVAAVSAVVSAFHGGSELLKHVKKKRQTRKARVQTQQDFEEKQLQDSLVSGEQQIGLRYAQDIRELGDYMRIGDGLARDRLFHIAIMMQGEVIKSLQLACQHDGAVLNLLLLHEASIMNRNNTFVTLDELKQRILVSRPILRQLQAPSEGSRPRQSNDSVYTIPTNSYSPISPPPDDYIPSAVTLPSYAETRESKHGLSEYFRLKRKGSSAVSVPKTNAHAANINFSEALEHLVRSRGNEDRAVIMQDIDEMICSYQGLNVRNGPTDSWGTNKYNGGSLARQDTLAELNTQDSYKHGQMDSNLNGTQTHNNQPPPPPEAYRPSFNNGLHSPQDQQLYNQQYAAKNTYPHMQTQAAGSRRSDVSATSSAFSDAVSLNRNSSNSSQESNPPSATIPSDYSQHRFYSSISPLSSGPTAPQQQYDADRSVHSTPAPTSPLGPQHTLVQNDISRPNTMWVELPANEPVVSPVSTNSPTHMPWPGTQQRQSYSSSHAPWNSPQQYQNSTQQDEGIRRKPIIIPQYHPMPNVGRDTSSTRSNKSDRTETASGFAAVAKAANILGSGPATTRLRQGSIAPSIASTDSSNSIGILPGSRMSRDIRSDRIQSGPAGKEKMMHGRPCKDNNYWGFCKGAWAVREDSKKGITVRTQPMGLYNSKQIWECTSCTFKGDTFSAPHPTRKNKTEIVVDPRIHVSMAGIRYRWIFLAKSHVKKKATDAVADEANYGCIICSEEGNLSSVFGGVETLMNHIALTHVAEMTDKTRKKVNCILGRMATQNENFDINVPIFATTQVEELAA